MISSLGRWGGVSRQADLGGPVHYVDFGGPADGPALVLVHGLGGSHLDWVLLAGRLTDRFRVFAPDLLGYGLNAPDHRLSTITANTDLIRRFITEVVGRPVAYAARQDLHASIVHVRDPYARTVGTAKRNRRHVRDSTLVMTFALTSSS